MSGIQPSRKAAFGPAAHPAARKVTLLLAATLTIMAGTTIAPALPAIEVAFAGTDHVQLMSRMVLTLPSLFVVFCAPLAGALADRLGRIPLLAGSVLLYAIAGVSGLFVDSLAALLAGRAALGIAIGGIMTLVTALVGDYFSGQERERFLGAQQAFTQLGGVVFVLGGGLLADIHWRAPFAVYALAFLLAPAVVLFLMEPEKPSPPRADGQASGVARVQWLSIALVCLCAYLINASFYTVPSQLPFHIRELGIARPSSAGVVIATFNLVACGTAFGYARARARLGFATIFALGLFTMAGGFWMLAGSSSLPSILAAVAVMGAGLGILMPNLMSAGLSSATPATRGRIAGLVTASMFLGHFTSPFASQFWIGQFGYAATYRDVGLLVGTAALAALIVAARGRTVLAGR